MKDKITLVVSGIITLGSMLWTPLGGYINAAGGQAEITTAVLAVYAVVHSIVHYGHGKVAGTLVVLALMLPAPVMAQEPAPAPDRGGVLVTYSLAHDMPTDGRIGFEGDLRVGGTPLLLVGHVLNGAGGVGPRVQHNIGPITLFGHTLFGKFETGADAMNDSQLKHGAGVEVPVGDHAVVRIGVDHTPGPMDSSVTATSVGFGWRF